MRGCGPDRLKIPSHPHSGLSHHFFSSSFTVVHFVLNKPTLSCASSLAYKLAKLHTRPNTRLLHHQHYHHPTTGVCVSAETCPLGGGFWERRECLWVKRLSAGLKVRSGMCVIIEQAIAFFPAGNGAKRR